MAPRGRPKRVTLSESELQEGPSIYDDTITRVSEEDPEEDPKVEVKKEVLESLLAKVESLEKKDEENQKQLKMLYAVADKGRVFNYENSKVEKKPVKVKLSVFEDKIIVGWRTIKDRLIKNPSTGTITGEEQEYEILLFSTSGETTKAVINGYAHFSDVRYTDRVECEILGRKEDYNGNITFDVSLPDNYGGKQISIDSKFLN